MGTSFNSLGFNKESEISILSAEEAEIRQREVDQYLHGAKREHNGEMLQLISFFL